MRKFFVPITAVMVLGSCLLSFSGKAQAAVDVNSAFQLLSAELQKKGAVSADVTAAALPIKSMLGLGVSSSDVKTIVLGFIQNGFKGKDLSSLTGMVGDLTQSGLPVKTASGVVSQAVQQASAGGLQGSGLIAKVQTAVNEKKAQLASLKDNADKLKKGFGSLFGH